MPRFAYTGQDRGGAQQQGSVDAPSRREALRVLAGRGLRVGNLAEAAESGRPAPKKAEPAKADGGGLELSLKRSSRTAPRRQERVPFLESLYDLTTSGLSAGEAVRLLSVRIKEPRLRALCTGLWERISEGITLSRAMTDFPRTFDDETINLIQAGEATGSLNDTLARLIAHLNEQRELRRQLLTALAYPVFMVFVAGGVILFFLFFLLPRLQALLTSLGGKMPFSTELLISLANFALHYGIFVLLGLILAAISFWRWRATEPGRQKSDAWLLRLPLIGPFAVAQTVLAFSQTLSVLLENGINASEALRMTERQISNRVHRAAFKDATGRVLEGEALSVAITRTGCFPELVLDRLAVGENTGNVVRSLKDIARTYQKLISQRLNLFTSIIASAVLMGVFIFVGFIAFAIVSAVFEVSASFKV